MQGVEPCSDRRSTAADPQRGQAIDSAPPAGEAVAAIAAAAAVAAGVGAVPGTGCGTGGRGPRGIHRPVAPPPGAAAPGGAMPYSRSLRRPSALIQSVLQGGASTVRTSASGKPPCASARRTSSAITRVAGQPV